MKFALMQQPSHIHQSVLASVFVDVLSTAPLPSSDINLSSPPRRAATASAPGSGRAAAA